MPIWPRSPPAMQSMGAVTDPTDGDCVASLTIYLNFFRVLPRVGILLLIAVYLGRAIRLDQ